MRWGAIGLLMLLAACARSEIVHLRNPTTGETLQCGPYTQYYGELRDLQDAAILAQSQLRFCVNDYQQRGFERIQPSTTTATSVESAPPATPVSPEPLSKGDASAQTDAQLIQTLNNVQYEASRCASYYAILLACVEKEKDPGLIAKAVEAKKYMIQFALALGGAVGLTDDEMISRLVIEKEHMETLTQNSCMNMTSLVRRYDTHCTQLVENGDSIVLNYLRPSKE